MRSASQKTDPQLTDFLDICPAGLRHKDANYTAYLCIAAASITELRGLRKSYLHEQEDRYFSTLETERRQYSYLLGRLCAKAAIARKLQNTALTDLRVESGVFQQPVVCYESYSCPNEGRVQVSISHTDLVGAAIAFPEAHPMAIDIEKIEAARARTITTQVTDQENELANTLPLSANARLTLIWTIKESLSKVLRCGMTVPFKLLEVTDVEYASGVITTEFQNFPQYKGLSFQGGEYLCTIIAPKNTDIDLDLDRVISNIKFYAHRCRQAEQGAGM